MRKIPISGGSQSGLDDEIAGKDRDGRNFPRITGKRFLLF